ncbi:MAG: hypothetical protein SVC26_08810 [Pseudomonadota bacterium]|nr:hypothetical protein [Pseudomonadota bacterium]
MTPSHIPTTDLPTMDVIVIGELSSAIVDIYFKLREHEFSQYYALDSHSESLLNDLQTIYRGQTIIFVRHIVVDAFKWLMKQPDYQAIYFTDDNITDLIKDSSFPLHYRRRNLWRYLT